MGLGTGLAAIKKAQKERAERAEAMNAPKADWFTFSGRGTSQEVMFLQELDEEHENFRPENGEVVTAVEHIGAGPEGFKRRALCTLDTDGECFACDQRAAAEDQDDRATWRQRTNVYMNVAVVDKDGNVRAEILTRPLGSSFIESLINEATDEDSITDAVYRISKTGEGPKTAWLLKRLPKAEPFNLDGAKAWNIKETALRKIPYSEQAKWYGVQPAKEPEPEPVVDNAQW